MHPLDMGKAERDECCRSEDRQRNRELVLGETILLEGVTSAWDRYGRLLRHQCLNGWTWVNGDLEGGGYARVTTYPPDDRYEAVLLSLQAQA